MFGKLKEKLKSWTQNFSKKTEEIEEKTDEKEQKKQETLDKLKEASEEKQESKIRGKIEEQIERAKEEINKIAIHEKAEGKEKKIDRLEEIEKTLEAAKDTLEKRKAELEEETEIHCKKPFIKETEEETEKQGFFKKITSKVTKVRVSEKDFEIYEDELKMLLLENNVAFEVAEKIIEELKREVVGKEFLKKEVEGQIGETLKEIIVNLLIEPFDVVDKIRSKQTPYIILFCGINGTGKTTTIAKIANYLKEKKISCVMAAADTFRAASIEQIKKHGEKLDIKVIAHDYGSDPAAVAFDAVKYAEKNKIDCVLIDTAGRMHSEKNLLKELEKISRVAKPDLKLFVGEAIAGNDSLEQVRSFNFAIGIDGIILTKADTDEKGGTSLSVGYVTKKPILYLGVGQEYDKIIPFDKNKFVEELGL